MSAVVRPEKSAGAKTFADGVIPTASDFNGDFDAITAVLDANIDNANIKAAAGIAATKLADLPASKITTGELPNDRIASLPASKVTTGTFDGGRIPGLAASKITSGDLIRPWKGQGGNSDFTLNRIRVQDSDAAAPTTANTAEGELVLIYDA